MGTLQNDLGFIHIMDIVYLPIIAALASFRTTVGSLQLGL
jgi:hypothetical protein